MSKIESTKDYTGKDLETIFFRPMLSGANAAELGIKVLYNMPVPTAIHFWKRGGDVLKKYTSSGWDASSSSASGKFQKTINLSKVKAEMGYAAHDYFSKVYELITNRSDVNLDDLSGTDLEVAETALFKEAIEESIRATMWLGDTDRASSLNTFDGFLKELLADAGEGDEDIKAIAISEDVATSETANYAEGILKKIWDNSTSVLKEFKSQGNLVYLVTSDIYAKYEAELDNVVLDSAYLAKQNGRERLSYRGIPVIDVLVSGYINDLQDMPNTFAILTDRRNLALAVNTADFPGTEVRMWYNPDLMENRQRAIFMAGCNYLLPELVSIAVGGISVIKSADYALSATAGTIKISIKGDSFVSSVSAQGLNASNVNDGTLKSLTKDATSGVYSASITGTALAKVKLSITCVNGDVIVVTL